MQFDYKGVEALYTVIQTQSFEEAAQALCITQSAVSQRIKNLQIYHGDALLIKELPYRATEYAEKLLIHYKKVVLLEKELESVMASEIEPFKLSIAMSRDILETWFIDSIKKSSFLDGVVFDITSVDQELTIDFFKRGEVLACFSTAKKPLPGCLSDFVGNMRYVLVATPQFKSKYFKTGKHKSYLLRAPTIKYDNHDFLQDRYLEKYFNIYDERPCYYTLPSIKGFREFVLADRAYALIPEIDIIFYLNSGKLVNLFPDKVWNMPIYLHHWVLNHTLYQEAIHHIFEVSSKRLNTSNSYKGIYQ